MSELNNAQLKQISEFLSNLSLFFFATVIAPIFINSSNTDYFNTGVGLFLGVVGLILSVVILREVKQND